MALLRLVLWYVSLTTPLVENEHNIFSSKCGECISFTRSGNCFHGNGSHQICKACCLYQNYTTTLWHLSFIKKRNTSQNNRNSTETVWRLTCQPKHNYKTHRVRTYWHFPEIDMSSCELKEMVWFWYGPKSGGFPLWFIIPNAHLITFPLRCLGHIALYKTL